MVTLKLDMLKNISDTTEVVVPENIVATPEVQEISEESKKPSMFDLIESDEVPMGVDFYDNSLAHELGSEKDIAELLVSSGSEAPSVTKKENEEKTPTSGIKINLGALTAPEKNANEEKVNVQASEEIVDQKTMEAEMEILEESPKEEVIATLAPKIGKLKKKEEIESKVETPVVQEIKKEEGKIEEFFPNIIIGFEEDEKITEVKEVAKTLSESRKWGLLQLFWRKALIQLGVVMTVLAGIGAFGFFVASNGFLDTIKVSVPDIGSEFHMDSDAPVDMKDVPKEENIQKIPEQEKPLPQQDVPKPVQQDVVNNSEPEEPIVQEKPPVPKNDSYQEGVDFRVIQGNKKNVSTKK